MILSSSSIEAPDCTWAAAESVFRAPTGTSRTSVWLGAAKNGPANRPKPMSLARS